MAESCGVLPPEINRTLNELAKVYMGTGLEAGAAKKEAANTLKEAFSELTLGSQAAQPTQPGIGLDPLFLETMTERNLDSLYTKIGEADRYNGDIDSVRHKKHLQHVMDSMVSPLISALDGIQVSVRGDKSVAGVTRGEIDIKAKTLDVTIAMPTVFNSLRLSAQEVFVHELVHGITTYFDGKHIGLKGPTVLRQGMRKLFNLGKQNIKWQDLVIQTQPGQAITPAEEADAKARWDYIFNSPNGLYEFIAFGNTNAQFKKLLSGIKVAKEVKVADTLLDKVAALFQRIVDWLSFKASSVPTEKDINVATALEQMTLEIAGIRRKNNKVLHALGYGGEIARYGMTKPIQLMFSGLTKAMEALPEGKTKEIATGIRNLPVAVKTNAYAQGIAWVASRIFNQRQHFFINLLAKLPSELIGMTDDNQRFWARLRYSKGVIDVARHKMKDATILNYKEMFKHPLTEDEDRALYNLIAADIPALAIDNRYTYAEILELIKDPAKVQAEIKKYSDKLVQAEGNIGYGLIKQAHGLGTFMLTKKTFNDVQMMNVSNIVDLRFDPNAKTNNLSVKDSTQAAADVDILKSLYALQAIDPRQKAKIATVFGRELEADSVDNGVVNFISLIEVHKKESLEKNFDNNPRLKMAGYTTDIFNPNISLAYSDNPEDPELIAAGYVRQGDPLKKAKGAQHKTQYMYISNSDGMVKYTKAIVSLTSEQKAGTGLVDVYRSQGFGGPQAITQAAEDTKRILASAGDPYAQSYQTDEQHGMVPVTNLEGFVVGFRYVMNEATRADVLIKNYKASTVIGTMYEQMTDKYNTKDLNSLLVADLVADRKEFGVKKAKDYITITKDHPRYGELYKRLPIAMVEELDKAFGKGKLVVRENLVDLVFGFPNYSMSKEGLNTFVGKGLTMLVKGYLATWGRGSDIGLLPQNLSRATKDKQVEALIRQVESGWQEVVKELKNTIVLKTMVLPMNILSNLIFSFMHGMPLDYILRKQAEAIVSLQSYTAQYRRRIILEQRLGGIGLSASSKKAIEGEINQLTQDIDANPIKHLVDKGVINTIIEDVSLELEEDTYSLKSKLIGKMEGTLAAIPKPIKEVGKYALMLKGTKPYGFLETATKYSDFVARYAMYEFLTKEKKVDQKEALATTMAAFVEYDPPTSKELQFLNDIGFAMFTKYAIRTQKVIAKLFLEKPDTAVALYLMEHQMGMDIVSPADSFLVPNWNQAFQDLPTYFYMEAL